MEGFTGWVAGISLVVGLVYVGLSLRWGRTNASQNTAAIWARTLLNALLFFYVFMAALPWLAHWLLPAPLPLAQPFRTIGGGLLFGLGMVGWLTCLDAFSRRGRGTPSPLDAPRHLVTSGLFRVVRNPIIASEVLVIWGISLYVASWGVAIYAVLVTLGGHLIVVRVEEPVLRKRFADEYEAYCRTVPRWLPRLRGGGEATTRDTGNTA